MQHKLWPTKGAKLAWSPPGISSRLGVIPVSAKQKEITWEQYQSSLKERIKWLESLAAEPEKVFQEMWWDKMGNCPSSNLLSDHLMTGDVEDLLALNHDLSRDQFPMPVKPTDDHKETLLEMNHLSDLMLELTP